MTGFLDCGGDGTSGIDVGDIGHSLRFRGAQYLSKTLVLGTDRDKWSYSCWVKRGALGALDYVGIGTSGNHFYFNTSNNFVFAANSLNKLVTTQVFRDPTAWIHILLSYDAANATAALRARLYVDGVEVTAFSTDTRSAIAATQCTINTAVAHVIGKDPATATYYNGYLSRIAFIDGTALDPTSFITFNSTINEWVSKSQSAVKAVVDAGGTNSFMLDFDNATSLTTLGYDKSSKGNNWTLNNFSLTAGTIYDHMLDVPGNSFATLNAIYPSAASITNGNLTSGTTAVRAAFDAIKFDSKWEVTAGASAVTAGVISGTGTTNTTSVTANKVFAFRLTTAGALDYKNVTDAGAWTSITTGLTGEQYPYGITQAANWNFGQAPLHASATYQAAAGGYFFDTTSGYKALCQANLPTPAILNPKNGFVAVTDTEANIDATLATARTGWTNFVDIKKNRAAVESWAWQFSYDSTNEYAIGAASSVHQAKRAMSGANTWAGYSIRIGATYGTAAGSVSHTNGVATTVTHNIGVSARQLILIFRRASTTAVPVYHPDLTSGELLDLCSTAADAASTLITSVATNSFQIGSGNTTGTYDYLVCSELSGFFDLGKYTGNGLADGPYYDAGHKPALSLIKEIGNIQDFVAFDTARATYNADDYRLFPNATTAEVVTGFPIDEVSMGIKVRNTGNGTNRSGGVYVVANWASVAGKFSLGR